MTQCFHCLEPVPADTDLSISFQQTEKAVCCPGCKAVAEAIIDQGLEHYYQFRTEAAERAAPLVPDELAKLQVYDDPGIQQSFVLDNEGTSQILISIEGISCSACAWLIEKHVSALPGLIAVSVNASAQRASVRWESDKLKLSDILGEIRKIGYKAWPFEPDQDELNRKKESRRYVIRIGLAGLMTMQVMMIAVALYFGVFSGIDAEVERYLRWISLLLSTPVIAWSAVPFLKNAWRAVKQFTLNMDVPVSIAIYGAWTASAVATIENTGEVYFESICMFTFLLLIGKFLEFKARLRASEASANLMKLVPIHANLKTDQGIESVPVSTLAADQHIVVKAGETIPVDAEVISGRTSVDESMLTGEYTPVDKLTGATIFAGTLNHDGLIEARVTATGQQTMLSSIVRLQHDALTWRPGITRLTDTIAHWFVLGLLVIASITWTYWHFNQPEEAFWITLAVLVATCPCALSLATPTALTCANSTLARNGLLIKAAHALETLPKVDLIAFDKTGTLTAGNVQLTQSDFYLPDTNSEKTLAQKDVMNWIANLELASEHPVAKAFQKHFESDAGIKDIEVHPGSGISGQLPDGQIIRVGSARFTSQFNHETGQIFCTLANPNTPDIQRLTAAFSVSDTIRNGTSQVIEALDAFADTIMLTGDNSNHAESVANETGIRQIFKGCTPADKLAHIRTSNQEGKTTMMIGDGINDGPVLSAASVSVAMESGADVARSAADIVITGNELTRLPLLFTTARRTKEIIQQNLLWAFGYNAVILPLAVSGLVYPWIAVIGMSLSSLIVVTNSLRLLKS